LQKGERKSETIDIEEVLGSSVEMLHGELVARRIKVSAVPAGARLSVLGDPIQIQQVVLNLLVNAMDAMESTAVDQRVISISSGVNSDDMVQVEIRDRGVGIRAEDENRLFEPFFTRKDHGLGLGLAICSTIMQAHGGSLRLANDDSGGAVATLLLPTHQRAFR